MGLTAFFKGMLKFFKNMIAKAKKFGKRGGNNIEPPHKTLAEKMHEKFFGSSGSSNGQSQRKTLAEKVKDKLLGK